MPCGGDQGATAAIREEVELEYLALARLRDAAIAIAAGHARCRE
jgi:hypothetical protein